MTNMEHGLAGVSAAADIRQNPYKADFPLLADKPQIAFLDSGATAQRPTCVLDAQRRFYETMNANPLRGLYSLSVEATEAIAEVRARIARLLGAIDERGRAQAATLSSPATRASRSTSWRNRSRHACSNRVTRSPSPSWSTIRT